MKACRLGLVVAVLGVVLGLGSCTETNETKCTKDFLGNPTCTTTKGSDVGDWLKKNWYLVALGAVVVIGFVSEAGKKPASGTGSPPASPRVPPLPTAGGPQAEVVRPRPVRSLPPSGARMVLAEEVRPGDRIVSEAGSWLVVATFLSSAEGRVGWRLDSGDVIHAQVGHRYQVE